ncbi:MAG: alpha/beta hydrolase [Candidatus Thermoplasmatota archaeon]|nr:alpha/beta hydrolase [Candidatus Thermoplasmatota archaeon]MCL5793294.1 alpha/beta hydrolase [Candidatus Thermoplasmatota archaeon]
MEDQIIKIETFEGDIALRQLTNPASRKNIVFLSGLSGDRHYWDRLFDQSSLRQYNLIAVDLPGQGESKFTPDYSFSMESQARAVLEALKHLGIVSFTGVFHSMAGVIGLIMCELKPSMLSNYVGLESQLVYQDTQWSAQIAASRENEYKEIWDDMLASADQFYTQALASTNPREIRDTIKILVDSARKSPYYAIWRSAVSLCEYGKRNLPDKLELLRGISSHYLIGQKNYRDFDVYSPIFKKYGIEVEFIRRAGHVMMLENPEETAATISRIAAK